jgi:hypothetical protein
MSNELTVQGEDGFAVAERNSNFIIGTIIKFVKGAYIANKAEEMPAGIILLVVRIITCWVRWWDNAPTDHRVTHEGQIHPQCEDLPDRDENLWQISPFTGEPSDPWVDTRYVQLLDLKTGRDYTFIGDTHGGRMAVGELKSSVRNIRMAHPNALPIIKFGFGGTFKSKRFGLVARPVFIIADWHKGLKDVPAQSDQQLLAPAKEQLETPGSLPKKTLAEEMADEIPNFDEAEAVAPPQQSAPPPPTTTSAVKATPANARPNARRDLKKRPQKTAKPAGKKQNILDAG